MSNIVNVDSGKLKTPEIAANKTSSLSGLSQAKSWCGFAVKVGASIAALGALSHVVYQGFYSPSRASSDPSQSPFNSIYSKHVTSCDDTSFKTLQTFFNVYETQGSLLNMLGFKAAEPFGDLQAFILDQNFEGLQCAYSSYSDGQINEQMKNRLLGRVMQQMANHKEGFEKYVKWLVELGANPNLVKKGTTPLMLAYRMPNADLYEFLISKGASPDFRIFSKSDGGSVKMQPILKIIADELGGVVSSPNETGLSTTRTTRRRMNTMHCDLYKRIVDSSLRAHTAQIHSFPGLEKDELQKEMYRTIARYTCPDTFAVDEVYIKESEPTQKGFFEDPLAWGSDKIKSAAMHIEAMKRAREKFNAQFLKDIPEEDIGAFYKLLKLNKDDLDKMDVDQEIKEIKKACKKLRVEYHPDKKDLHGRTEAESNDFFEKVNLACEELLNSAACNEKNDKEACERLEQAKKVREANAGNQ